MTKRSYTNKIEYILGKKVKFDKNLLPEGVVLREVEITYWPDYKPRGRAAHNAA